MLCAACQRMDDKVIWLACVSNFRPKSSLLDGMDGNSNLRAIWKGLQLHGSSGVSGRDEIGFRLPTSWFTLRFSCYCNSLDLKGLVGANGFEPSTSWSRTRRASQAALRPDRQSSEQRNAPSTRNRLAQPRSHA